MYSEMIKQAAGCDDAEAEIIEDFMRNIIFRSTLDWHTREELADAALLARGILQLQRES